MMNGIICMLLVPLTDAQTVTKKANRPTRMLTRL